MNILISHNWLKEYLEANVTPKEITKYLSLCGPSVEKITKSGKDYIYDIEITTNRVDCMSIMGIAREANAVLPSFKKKAKFRDASTKKHTGFAKNNLLDIQVDPKLVNRVIAVVMEVENKVTPKLMKERLESAGMRSLNPIIDITNYVMQEIGHPTHVFDYDLLRTKKLVFRLSKKGEKIITLDGKEYVLPGDDIVVDNGKGEIVDLPGIMGTKNSVVNKNTKRIVFFINSNDHDKIRKTSMKLGIRTNAAILEEKGLDPELASIALARGLELYKEICNAKIISKIYDLYPNKITPKTVKVNHDFIEKIIGIKINSKKVLEILKGLGFQTEFYAKKGEYQSKIPSWRAGDVQIPEDLVEEVARIYGYFNLTGELMSGQMPKQLLNSPFDFENKIKYILKSHGGLEVYTNSLTSKDMAGSSAISLKNPLGEDAKFLRSTLKPSLVDAVNKNVSEKNPFYLFELANIYLPRKNDLPEERMTLGVKFANYEYRNAKGILEALYKELNILENVHLNEDMYFEIDLDKLRKGAREFLRYQPIPKYPAQVEDLTLTFSRLPKIGEVIDAIKNLKLTISNLELVDIYKNSYTFRIWYQDPDRTLNDKDVEKIREKVLKIVREKFGGVVKD